MRLAAKIALVISISYQCISHLGPLPSKSGKHGVCWNWSYGVRQGPWVQRGTAASVDKLEGRREWMMAPHLSLPQTRKSVSVPCIRCTAAQVEHNDGILRKHMHWALGHSGFLLFKKHIFQVNMVNMETAQVPHGSVVPSCLHACLGHQLTPSRVVILVIHWYIWPWPCSKKTYQHAKLLPGAPAK